MGWKVLVLEGAEEAATVIDALGAVPFGARTGAESAAKSKRSV